MGVTRQYIYKLVKESKLRASRLSGKKSLIRRADIELMMKTKPYERIMPKEDFDITEYYTAEEIAQKYKVNAKWVWTYTRQHKVPKVRIRQFNYYSKKGGMSWQRNGNCPNACSVNTCWALIPIRSWSWWNPKRVPLSALPSFPAMYGWRQEAEASCGRKSSAC